MAITQAICNSFKKELMEGVHNFKNAGGDAIKLALYTSAATLDKTTTAYSATNEVVGAGYSAGGNTLVNVDPVLSSDTALIDFNDSAWAASTITARGALMYNSTDANKSVLVLDFGADKSSSSGAFTIVFPTPDASNAILRIV